MKLLLAEDERQAGEYLVKGLGENGWVVDWVQNGVDAVHLAANAEYDVIVLDVGLPRMDGWETIKRIRHDNQTPVLFLTARDRVEDRVRGLELGADDYLVKPFAFSELLARVRALQRRGKQQEPDILRIADLEVHLLRRTGEVLSRTMIAEQVWDMNFDSDTNVVEVAVRRLRAKIDDPFDKKLIHTVRGFGYVLEDRG